MLSWTRTAMQASRRLLISSPTKPYANLSARGLSWVAASPGSGKHVRPKIENLGKATKTINVTHRNTARVSATHTTGSPFIYNIPMDLGDDKIIQKLYVSGKLFEVERSTNAELKGTKVGTQQATGVLSNEREGDMKNDRDNKRPKVSAHMADARPIVRKLSLGLLLSVIRDSNIQPHKRYGSDGR